MDRDPEKVLMAKFRYPGHYFLPDMKFGLDFVKGLNKYLTSWKSADDPSSGEYTNKMESEGYPQILLRKGFQEEWRRADWSNGCIRKADLNCSGGDGFVKQRGVKVTDTRKTWFNVSMNLEECEKVCLRNCNCTAYANSDVTSGGSGCLIWLDDLVDIRMYGEDGQDIY
ncbi:G-type lectin S-receptor-like serine/threonine-protein kinase isoform X1, partial [Tanacetum coccineum]